MNFSRSTHPPPINPNPSHHQANPKLPNNNYFTLRIYIRGPQNWAIFVYRNETIKVYDKNTILIPKLGDIATRKNS